MPGMPLGYTDAPAGYQQHPHHQPQPIAGPSGSPTQSTHPHASQQHQQQAVLNTWNGSSQAPHASGYPAPLAAPGAGYVPAPSDTHAAFGMLGGDPDWDNHLYSFMDQLGMFATDPNAPYASQMKMER